MNISILQATNSEISASGHRKALDGNIEAEETAFGLILNEDQAFIDGDYNILVLERGLDLRIFHRLQVGS